MKQRGFSLLELMISVAVLAILAAIAIPSYSAYTQKANRTDAVQAMTYDSQFLERCYSQTFLYAGCPGAPAGTAPSPQGFYSVTIVTTAAPAGYTITAVPIKAPQTSDASCTSLTLDNTGLQGSTGTGTTQTCWGTN